jgi:hypothetical protein
MQCARGRWLAHQAQKWVPAPLKELKEKNQTVQMGTREKWTAWMAKTTANLDSAQPARAPQVRMKTSAHTASRSTQSKQGAALETRRCALSTFGPPSRLPCRSFPRERKPQAPIGSNRYSLRQPVKLRRGFSRKGYRAGGAA